MKMIIRLTISYIPWIVYWTLCAIGNRNGGIAALAISMTLLAFSALIGQVSYLDTVSMFYYIIVIITTNICGNDWLIIGDGYFGYGFLTGIAIISFFLKRPFMDYYILNSCSKENLRRYSKPINIIWIGVFAISGLIFYYIRVPIVAVLGSNFFVLIGIISSVIVLKKNMMTERDYKNGRTKV